MNRIYLKNRNKVNHLMEINKQNTINLCRNDYAKM